MNFNKILTTFCVLSLVILFGEIFGISHQKMNHEKNFIIDEDRRGSVSNNENQVLLTSEVASSSSEPQKYVSYRSVNHLYPSAGNPDDYNKPEYGLAPTYHYNAYQHPSGGGGGGSGYGVTGYQGGFPLSHGGVSHYPTTSVEHTGHSGYKSLKGFLIPLAGIALLGAAAALSTSPVLLQLGVVNGRRRKRSLNAQFRAMNPKLRPSAQFR